ncbi:MAG TPA: c-type cytochrome, partial [Verrucomicrobiaceae bacterium]
DDKADVEARRAALNTLIEAKSPDARKVCEKLLTERGLSLSAAQGLANFDDPAIAETIIKRWRNFYPNEHSAVVAALASRPSFAKVLLDHLENGEGILPAGKKKKEKAQDPATAMIQRSDISPLIARQIRSFNDPALTKQLAEAWGEVHESSDDKKKLIASLKAKLTPKFIARGNPGQGRVLFAGICAACHKLYGEGNTIGPDLTGSGRHDVNYLIENIADPSAVVAADFTMSVITLKDGRVLNGIISAKTERTITVKMVGLETTVDRGDIAKQEQLPVSMMPEGQLTALNDEQLSNLISYLMSNGQVSLPQTAAAK